MISFKCLHTGALKQFLNRDDLNGRLALLNKRVIEHTCAIHEEFLKDLETREYVDHIFFSPQKVQMWHHKFDPHSLSDIPMAKLHEQPSHLVSHRSQSVQDFLKKTNYKQTLIQQALTKVQDQEDEQRTSTENERLE
jgi:hypothetical protein